MRLAPVPMYFANDAAEAIIRSADSSRTTHGAEEAVDACRYFAGLLVGALSGVDKQTLLSARYSPVDGLWEKSPLAAKVAEVADGSFKHREPPAIRGTGYVVESVVSQFECCSISSTIHSSPCCRSVRPAAIAGVSPCKDLCGRQKL